MKSTTRSRLRTTESSGFEHLSRGISLQLYVLHILARDDNRCHTYRRGESSREHHCSSYCTHSAQVSSCMPVKEGEVKMVWNVGRSRCVACLYKV